MTVKDLLVAHAALTAGPADVTALDDFVGELEAVWNAKPGFWHHVVRLRRRRYRWAADYGHPREDALRIDVADADGWELSLYPIVFGDGKDDAVVTARVVVCDPRERQPNFVRWPHAADRTKQRAFPYLDRLILAVEQLDLSLNLG